MSKREEIYHCVIRPMKTHVLKSKTFTIPLTADQYRNLVYYNFHRISCGFEPHGITENEVIEYLVEEIVKRCRRKKKLCNSKRSTNSTSNSPKSRPRKPSAK